MIRTFYIIIMLFLASIAIAEEASEFRLMQLNEAVAEIERELAGQQRELSSQEQRVRQSDQAISQNRAQQSTLNSQIRRLSQELASLAEQQTEVEQDLASQQQRVAEILVTVYQSSRQPMLKMLLSQDGPASLARTLSYFEYINDDQQEVLLEYEQNLEKLAKTKRQMNARQNQLGQDQRELDRAQAQLVQQQQQRRQVLSELARSVEGTESRLSRTQADQLRMTELVEKMREALANLESEAPPVSQGQLGWPVQGRVIQAFGAPLGDSRVRSTGIVIAAQEGAPVESVHAGEVVFSDWLRGFGMLVIIDHGDNIWTFYGRNDAILVEVGQWVSAGERIALVGSSGGFDSPGLYFEVRESQAPVNPVSWLARR